MPHAGFRANPPIDCEPVTPAGSSLWWPHLLLADLVTVLVTGQEGTQQARPVLQRHLWPLFLPPANRGGLVPWWDSYAFTFLNTSISAFGDCNSDSQRGDSFVPGRHLPMFKDTFGSHNWRRHRYWNLMHKHWGCCPTSCDAQSRPHSTVSTGPNAKVLTVRNGPILTSMCL